MHCRRIHAQPRVRGMICVSLIVCWEVQHGLGESCENVSGRVIAFWKLALALVN
jgi:hypothetical protein